MCLLLLLGLVLNGFSTTPDSEEPHCATVQNWVDSHPSSLPESVEELYAFPASYRTRIFSALSMEQKSEFVKRHIELGLKEHPEFNQTQIDFIQSLSELVTPSLYDPDNPSKVDVDKEVNERIESAVALAIFSRPELHKIVYVTAPRRISRTTLASLTVRASEGLAKMHVLAAAYAQGRGNPDPGPPDMGTIDCDCYSCNDCVEPAPWCVPEVICSYLLGCIPSSNGCAPNGTNPCIDVCKVVG